MFDSNTLGRLKLFGAVLSGIELEHDGRLAVMRVDHAMTAAAGGTYEDTEGLINLPLTVREIRASVFFKELGPTEFRVSLRSKGAIDVAAVAKQFGGGGHKNAAGCTVPGTYAEARRAVVAAVGPAIAAGLAQEPDQPRPRHEPAEGGGRRAGRRRWWSTSRPARPATMSWPSRGGRWASRGSATPARSTRWRPACCRCCWAGRPAWRSFSRSSDKTYLATIQFGQATSSYDAAGEPVGPARP